MSEFKSVFGKSYKVGQAKNGAEYSTFTVDKAELLEHLERVTTDRVGISVFTREVDGAKGNFTSVSLSVRDVQKPSFQKKTTFVRKSTLNKVVE